MKRAHASGVLTRETSRVHVHEHDYRRDYAPGAPAIVCRVCGFRVSGGDAVDLITRSPR